MSKEFVGINQSDFLVYEKCNNKFVAWHQYRKGRNFDCIFVVSQ